MQDLTWWQIFQALVLFFGILVVPLIMLDDCGFSLKRKKNRLEKSNKDLNNG